jgi:hypothetical protein
VESINARGPRGPRGPRGAKRASKADSHCHPNDRALTKLFLTATALRNLTYCSYTACALACLVQKHILIPNGSNVFKCLKWWPLRQWESGPSDSIPPWNVPSVRWPWQFKI